MVKEIENIIKVRGGELLESFRLFDVYKGKQIEDGYKSIAYTITFRDKERTLQDLDVNKVIDKIIDGLTHELNAKIRDK